MLKRGLMREFYLLECFRCSSCLEMSFVYWQSWWYFSRFCLELAFFSPQRNGWLNEAIAKWRQPSRAWVPQADGLVLALSRKPRFPEEGRGGIWVSEDRFLTRALCTIAASTSSHSPWESCRAAELLWASPGSLELTAFQNLIIGKLFHLMLNIECYINTVYYRSNPVPWMLRGHPS